MKPLDERMMKDDTKEVIKRCHHLNTLINLSINKGGPSQIYVPLDVTQKKIQPMKYSTKNSKYLNKLLDLSTSRKYVRHRSKLNDITRKPKGKSRMWNTVQYQWPSFLNKIMGERQTGLGSEVGRDGGEDCSIY